MLAKEAIIEVAVVAVTKEQEVVQAAAVTETVQEVAIEIVPAAEKEVVQAEVLQEKEAEKEAVAQAAAAVTVVQTLAAALAAEKEVAQAAVTETVIELETKNYYKLQTRNKFRVCYNINYSKLHSKTQKMI